MLYNVSFDVCGLFITAIALILMPLRKDMHRKDNRILFAVLVMHLTAAILDIWSAVANSYPQLHSTAFRSVLNSAFLLIHTGEACAFTVFLHAMFGSGLKRSRKKVIFFFLPAILTLLLPLLLNPFLHQLFYYDETGLYRHGWMIYLLCSGACFYILLSIALLQRHHHLLSGKQGRFLVALIVLCLFPMIVQMTLLPTQLISIFFQSVGLFGLMYSIDNTDELYNPVSKVSNRYSFIKTIATLFDNAIEAEILIVKLSHTGYFHAAALRSYRFSGLLHVIADWLNDLTDAGKAYDCERGVFILLLPYATEADSSALCDKIRHRFHHSWHYRDQEVVFPVQLTTLRFPQEARSIEHLLNLIDLPYIGREPLVAYRSAVQLEAHLLHREKDLADVQAHGGIPQALQQALDDFLVGVSSLTPAEHAILVYYLEGLAPSEIPERTYVSINTVKKHTKSIYRKLGVGSRSEIIMYADLFRCCGRQEELRTL